MRRWPAVLLSSALAVGCAANTEDVDGGFGFDTGPRRDATVRTDGSRPRDGTVRPPDAPVARDAGPPVDCRDTAGDVCDTEAECDDGCFCNGVEPCVGRVCRVPVRPGCDDGFDCTMDSCDEATRSCSATPDDALCDDGRACSADSCDVATGCVATALDVDGDGQGDAMCGGTDCNDADPDVFMGAVEDCANAVDDDCDRSIDGVDPDCIPVNSTCATATMLPGPGTYYAATTGLSADYSLSCRTSGPDAVFRFTLTDPSDVRVELMSASTSDAIALRPWASCAAGPDDRCGSGLSPNVVMRRGLPAGDYAIIVKTSVARAATLTLAIDPATAIDVLDRCDATTEDVSAGGTFTGRYEDTRHTYALSCHSGTYPEAAYRLELTAPRDVRLTLQNRTATGTTTGYLSLVRDCSMTATTVQCASGSPATILRRALPAGVYYVLVEGAAWTTATWSLDVQVFGPDPRAPGDACSTALNVLDRSAMADIAMLEPDTSTSCGPTSGSWRDGYFTFTLASPRNVTVAPVQSTGGTFYFSLRTDCPTNSSDIYCRSGAPPAPGQQTWRSLAAGTYTAVVATTRTSGTVTVSATTSAPTPVPGNDVCTGAIDVSGGATRTDTLLGFANDAPSCGTTTARPDAFYHFTLTSRQDVSIIASRAPGTTGNIYLALRPYCDSSTNLACNTGNPAAIATTLDPGTYYVMAEMDSTATGEFEIRFLFTP